MYYQPKLIKDIKAQLIFKRECAYIIIFSFSLQKLNYLSLGEKRELERTNLSSALIQLFPNQ